MVQGARSILGGIQTMQLADDQDIPTLLIRQCGKLPPPLLTSTLHHSNLFLPEADLCKDNTPSAQGVAAATAVPSPKPSRLWPVSTQGSWNNPTILFFADWAPQQASQGQGQPAVCPGGCSR